MQPALLAWRQGTPTITQLAVSGYCFLAVPVIVVPGSVAIKRSSRKSSPAVIKKPSFTPFASRVIVFVIAHVEGSTAYVAVHLLNSWLPFRLTWIRPSAVPSPW
jgi:hypothetical protein